MKIEKNWKRLIMIKWIIEELATGTENLVQIAKALGCPPELLPYLLREGERKFVREKLPELLANWNTVANIVRTMGISKHVVKEEIRRLWFDNNILYREGRIQEEPEFKMRP